MTPAVSIEFNQVSHHFNHKQASLSVLQDVSFMVLPGEFVCLVGASGCGKSTILRLAAGLLTPSAGRILLARQPPAALQKVKALGWMAQHAALLPWATVLENISLPQRVNRRYQADDLPSPRDLLSMVGLSDFANVYPDALSGGMRRRVALARTLTTRPAVWLMDEPFAALDELTREALGGELLALWRRFRPTVLWVTHHLGEAVRLADRILLLSPGPARIIGDIRPDMPRPRDDTSPAFQAVVRQARRLLERGDHA